MFMPERIWYESKNQLMSEKQLNYNTNLLDVYYLPAATITAVVEFQPYQ